ncbi:ATP-binding protein [Pseudobacteriovorax antillogorgiicola]|uniref:histidine kinase n=1 Tax=Pseudobacteriovorax antillogorgiicola TaxID=1513793 RepID=A0A1Y6C986_9BACT|nr:ATP-binding protein [Pseudobacteriovorax antillogorgiicola]TCS49058.1 response regulator receiver domain-containing protein [Pseudobacteriovorax antillogorgiicola]SMF52396.1 Response regulator receiver domain-containing protein [Pseudobacteriovorax antillogorgiicola]
MSGLTLDDILSAMDEASVQERSSDYKIAVLVERSSIMERLEVAKEFIDETTYANWNHDDELKDQLADIDLVFLECRLIEGIKDISKIRQIRSKRPQMPILVTSVNTDPEFVASIYEAGATDFLTVEEDIRVIFSKIQTFLRMSKVLSLVEFKNEEVINTMQTLRRLQSSAKQEKVSRILAETQRDFAEEAAGINQQMKEILDHLNEAFFFVDPQLQVGDSTSTACEQMFGTDIARQYIGSTLNFKDPEIERHMAMALDQVFEDIFPEAVSLSLMPKVVETQEGRILDFTYTVVRGRSDEINKVIVVASDITKTHHERQELERQFQENRCIMNILRHMDAFTDFVADFKGQLQKLRSDLENRSQVKHILHTLKGNSLVFEIYELGHLIHDTETLLGEQDDLELAPHLDKIESCLQGFLDHHKDLLDIDFRSNPEKTYTIDETDFNALDNLFKEVDAPRRAAWQGIKARLRHKHIGELCGQFEPLVKRLAKQEEKEIRLKIIGEELKLDLDPIRPLFKSLIHLISNACDHGIEPPYERLANKKTKTGHIFMRFLFVNQSLKIRIVDDGRGIDWDELIKKAVEKGFAGQLKDEGINRSNAYQILFWDGFSTASSITQTSGRGVGMSAIRAEVKRLGGTIAIQSKLGRGTKTEIIIPLYSLLKLAS